MKTLHFAALLVCVAAAAAAGTHFLAGYAEEQAAASDSAACGRKAGRSPQGKGAGAVLAARAIESYEQDVTQEPYFPGEFAFDGRSWNEVFEEKGESFAVYSSAYDKGSALSSIRIIPLGIGPGEGGAVLKQLELFLEKAFSSEVSIQRNVRMPEGCFDSGRRQYNASKILSGLMQTPWVHRETNLNLAVLNEDLFAPGLEFVFGYADYVHHVSVISLRRLRSSNKKLMQRRVFKIARHEIAHMYGLVHCTSPMCVMRGVNSLEELDASTLSMCNSCASKLAWRLGDDGKARAEALKAFYLKKFHDFFR